MICYVCGCVLVIWFACDCVSYRSWRHDILIKSMLEGLSQEQIDGAQRLGEWEANKVIATRVGDGFARWTPYTPAPLNETSSIGKYQFLPGQTYALVS